MMSRTPRTRSQEHRRPGFQLDLSRCVGCGSCVLACRIENRLPTHVSWRRVLQVNRPRIGAGPTYHLSVACHHCDHPPCVAGCPSGALRKRTDGLVELVADRCIGCRYCEMTCPFGAPSYDGTQGVMTKCHLCHHRLAEGLDPACVVACPTGALGLLPEPSRMGEDGAGPARKEGLAPAAALPGFGDPSDASPRFFLSRPGGSIRQEWFRRLEALMTEKEADDGGR